MQWEHLNDAVAVWLHLFTVVTEEEIALALTDGEVVTTPPSSLQNQASTNGIQDTETENDPLNYNMEETK